MLTVIVIVGLVLAVCLVVTTIPVSYAVTIHGAAPFHVTATLFWGSTLCHYQWDYTYGEKPTTTVTWLGRKAHPCAAQTDTVPDEAQVEAAAKAIEDATALTYDDVQHEADRPTGKGPTPEDAAPPTSWKTLVLNTSFIGAACTYVQRLLCHSRVRTLRLSGVIGLGEPHTTGIAAGACYALIPDSIDDLQFNFVAEEYDYTLVLQGHIYPLVFAAYTAAFAASRPVRQLIAYWRTTKRGELHHG